LHVFKRV
jgi:hypothetical protein